MVQSPSVVVTHEDQLELCIHKWVFVRTLPTISAWTMKQTPFCRLEAKEAKLGVTGWFFVFSTYRCPTWYDHVAWAVCWGSILAQSNLRYADKCLSLASPHLHFLCWKSLSTVQPSTAASIAAQGASAVVTRDTQLSSWWLYTEFCIKYSSYLPGGGRSGGLMISGYWEETSVFHRPVRKSLNNWGH